MDCGYCPVGGTDYRMDYGEIIRCSYDTGCILSLCTVLATPTAIMAAIGNATKHGFLVKEGDALERLAGVRIIAFDKTGTLTYGNPCVISVKIISEILAKMRFMTCRIRRKTFRASVGESNCVFLPAETNTAIPSGGRFSDDSWKWCFRYAGRQKNSCGKRGIFEK